ncbi:hemerythrin domain-containing protein [Shewanella cyperi]|uniref:Hemerythrin domain-containing protein n=1 Tax=Shewanella cyperi TaxID=2814292 RepID=A0A974XPG1_9GAMM|nr:hemerythrin domain-containing protein [Shewanella cyperi]QSX30851.1 hemerythrin domain-containing protein [Shewanella cyperi]
MLNRLMRDHKHIAILLKILKSKVLKLEEGEYVNFNLVRDVIEYMQGYAEHSHHPLEEIIYDYYLKANPEQRRINRLSEEHARLVEASGTLMATLNLILNDVVVAKDKLISELKNYVQMQEHHMLFEEREIFPQLTFALSDKDWATINELCLQKLIDDPLFSDNDNQLFDELRNYLAVAE